MTTAALWMGPVHQEARAAYHRARHEGMTELRARIVGNIASFRDCWAFRSKIAKFILCSVRSVQRALTQAEQLGLIGKARAKKGEKPPNMPQALPCGFSHRWTVGWGKAGKVVQQAVEAARARFIVRHVVEPVVMPRSAPALGAAPAVRQKTSYQRRGWTAEELDAELARLEREHKPPG